MSQTAMNIAKVLMNVGEFSKADEALEIARAQTTESTRADVLSMMLESAILQERMEDADRMGEALAEGGCRGTGSVKLSR